MESLFPELSCDICGGTMTKVSDNEAVCTRNETHRRKLMSEDYIEKILSILREHPNGIMVEQIKEQYGDTDSDMIHRALRELERRGVVAGASPFRYIGPPEETEDEGA
jgi:hypothetical protein